jgi:hypothetical protein
MQKQFAIYDDMLYSPIIMCNHIVSWKAFIAAERASLKRASEEATLICVYEGIYYLKPLLTAVHRDRARLEMRRKLFVGCVSTPPCGNFELCFLHSFNEVRKPSKCYNIFLRRNLFHNMYILLIVCILNSK